MKTKTHYVTVRLTFDKKCSRAVALREARDTIHGTNYCTEITDGDPGEYRVHSIKLAKLEGRRHG